MTPSIAVYGDAASKYLCYSGAVGDYDGDGNDEIACGYFNGAAGLVGVIDLDTFSGVANTVDVGGGNGTALMASVAQKTGTSSLSFGVKVAAMDVDGNGSDELVFADTAAVHDGIADDADSNCTAAAGSFCGEVYVYQVAGNSGALGAPPVAGEASPAALLNVIRGHGGSGSAFGSSLGVVSEGGMSISSWLAAQTSISQLSSVESLVLVLHQPSTQAQVLVPLWWETLQRSVTMRVDARHGITARQWCHSETSMASRHMLLLQA